MIATTITNMSEWSEQLVTRMATTIRDRRKQLGLTVQDVADRTEELGHPLNRSTLSDLENGRRKDRLMIGDALILAEVLDTSLAVLMFPHLPHGLVKLPPNRDITSIEAVKKISGLFDTVHMGDGPDVQRSLPELSIELEDARSSLHEYREKLNRVMIYENDPDMRDQIPLYMKLVEAYEAQERAFVREILLLGGVVDDG